MHLKEDPRYPEIWCNGRLPNKKEQTRLKKLLEHDDLNGIVVLGLATNQYNCWAWAVKIVTQEESPNSGGVAADLSMAEDFLSKYGYIFPQEKSDQHNVIIYGDGERVTHIAVKMSVVYNVKGGGLINMGVVWTSKLGDDLLITHYEDQLLNMYGGKIMAYFKRKETIPLWVDPPDPPWGSNSNPSLA